MEISKTVALVTGANRGVGLALVNALLNAGAKKVYATSRNLEAMPNFGDDRVTALPLDVTSQQSVASAFRDARDVNLLINNAGVLSFGDALSVSAENIEHNFSVNFYGVLNTCREASDLLAKNSGAIVNVLTLLSLASMPGMAAYNASKAAAWSLTLSLRASLKAKGVNVHSVFPGAIDTDMLAGIEIPKTSPADVANAIVQGVIAGKEDIFPDPMSQQVYKAWVVDHKAVEREFAGM